MTYYPNYKLVVCGGGPAGISPLVHLEEKEFLDSLIDQGLCIIDASSKIGSGSISKYQITANSLGKIFFEILKVSGSNLHNFLQKQASYKELMTYYEDAPPLPLVGEFLEDIGKYICKKIETNPNSKVLKMTRITSIRRRRDGLYEISYSPVFQQDTPKIISAEKILYNLGGEQSQDHPTLNGISKDKIVNSGDFISGVFDSKLEHILKTKDKPITISIIGSSHSGFSTLYRLRNHFGLLNNGKVEINMISKSQIRLFYDSTTEAILDGYDFKDEDVCAGSNRVNRYSGLRYDSFKLAKEVLSNCYDNLFIKKLSSISNSELNNSDFIIVCTGYKSRNVELLDEDNEPLKFLYENSCIKTNEHCNPMLIDGTVLKNFYQYGLGAGLNTGGSNYGEPSFKGKIDGVWVYQHLIPEKIFGKEFYLAEAAKNGMTL